MITVENLCFTYETDPLFRNLSLQVAPQEIVCLVGRSGLGKTTLFRLLNGLIQPDRGTITIANRSPYLGHPSIAYMTQDTLLLPWRSVWKNVLLPFELGTQRKAWAGYEEEALRLLQRMKLDTYRDYYSDQLSGGMQQRVALARTLLQQKPVLLLDEPFKALDVITRAEMYSLLQEERTQKKKTIFLITHDFRDALEVGDRILLLSEGKIAKEWRHPQKTDENAMRLMLSPKSCLE